MRKTLYTLLAFMLITVLAGYEPVIKSARADGDISPSGGAPVLPVLAAGEDDECKLKSPRKGAPKRLPKCSVSAPGPTTSAQIRMACSNLNNKNCDELIICNNGTIQGRVSCPKKKTPKPKSSVGQVTADSVGSDAIILQ